MKTDRSEWKRINLSPSSELSSGCEALAEFLKHCRRRIGLYSLFAAFPAVVAGGPQDATAESGSIPEPKNSKIGTGLLGKRSNKLSKPLFLRQSRDNLLPYQKGKTELIPNVLAGGGDDCPGEAVPNGTYTEASPFVDNGDTTGANNTVEQLYYYYYWNYYAGGPDRIYTFNVHNLGTNPRIQVTTTSPTYRPMIYLLGDDQGCPTGTGNTIASWINVNDSRSGNGNTATINIPTSPGSRMYRVFVDSSGANDAGPYTFRLQGVEVGPNRPPTATADSFIAYQNSGWTIDVLSNDTDPDHNWLSISGVTQGANGSVGNNDRYVTYTPNSGFTGVDTFTYTMSDGQGGSSTAVVTVTVNPNLPPVANDDETIVRSGLNVLNVLANDSDPEGNPLSLSGVTQGSNGSVWIYYDYSTSGYRVAYTPHTGFTGVDTFTYTLSDSRGGFDTATVKVTVGANVALAANGGVASASSSYSGAYPASAANNGDRRGTGYGNGGVWVDSSPGAYPDSLEIAFNGTKLIAGLDVFTVQDGFQNPVEPTEGMTFGLYGNRDFEVQYWDGAGWAAVPGGAVANNSNVWRRFTFSPVATTRIRVVVTRGQFNHAQIAEVEAWGVPAATPDPTPPPEVPVNVAAAANGGVATASSTFSAAYPASAVNNGDRRGTGYGNGGVWVDATSGAYPDTLEVAFNGAKTISEVGVFTVQDNFQNPAEPTESLTFAQYGVADFDVQYWDGGAWATVPGGTVTGSNRVWSKFTFFPVETTKIRISVRRGLFGFSQIAEVEAWTIVGDPPPPPPPAPVNVASAANGAVASASSSFSSAYPASAANNGDRRGTGYGNGGVWADGSPGAYPDSLEIAFDGSKTIGEIGVFTVQDNFQNPADPTEAMTFAQYGNADFEVQYWDGASWVTVSGGIVTGNNRVWRRLTFSPVTTTKIRVVVTRGLFGHSQIAEVEAYET
jgi:hypothetical protein